MVTIAYKICKREVEKAGSISAVAKIIGYQRSSLNLYLLGKYPAKSVAAIEKKILAAFTDKLLCPFTNEVIDRAECDEIIGRKINTTNPVLFKLQQHCKNCQIRQKHNIKEEFKQRIIGRVKYE